jgi:hypothetical protein
MNDEKRLDEILKLTRFARRLEKLQGRESTASVLCTETANENSMS